MTVEHLLKLLRNPRHLSAQDVYALHAVLQRYPYFQAGYALLAKAAQEQNPNTAQQAIQLAAVYATDRKHLKALLEDAPPFTSRPTQSFPSPSFPKPTPSPNAHPQKQVANQGDFVNEYVNNLRQRKERPITKQKSIEQQHIIQDFMQKSGRFKPQVSPSSSDLQPEVDVTRESTVFHDDLATESLAQVLVQQGNTARALAIYENLLLKFPEKRSYFVSRIQELKRLI